MTVSPTASGGAPCGDLSDLAARQPPQHARVLVARPEQLSRPAVHRRPRDRAEAPSCKPARTLLQRVITVMYRVSNCAFGVERPLPAGAEWRLGWRRRRRLCWSWCTPRPSRRRRPGHDTKYSMFASVTRSAPPSASAAVPVQPAVQSILSACNVFVLVTSGPPNGFSHWTARTQPAAAAASTLSWVEPVTT